MRFCVSGNDNVDPRWESPGQFTIGLRKTPTFTVYANGVRDGAAQKVSNLQLGFTLPFTVNVTTVFRMSEMRAILQKLYNRAGARNLSKAAFPRTMRSLLRTRLNR